MHNEAEEDKSKHLKPDLLHCSSIHG